MHIYAFNNNNNDYETIALQLVLRRTFAGISINKDATLSLTKNVNYI